MYCLISVSRELDLENKFYATKKEAFDNMTAQVVDCSGCSVDEFKARCERDEDGAGEYFGEDGAYVSNLDGGVIWVVLEVPDSVETSDEETEIEPTKAEKKAWKQKLYDSCCYLASERPEFAPRKKDSLETLLDKFLGWAYTFNEGYFSERKQCGVDRYSTWLVQEYNRAYEC